MLFTLLDIHNCNTEEELHLVEFIRANANMCADPVFISVVVATPNSRLWALNFMNAITIDL